MGWAQGVLRRALPVIQAVLLDSAPEDQSEHPAREAHLTGVVRLLLAAVQEPTVLLAAPDAHPVAPASGPLLALAPAHGRVLPRPRPATNHPPRASLRGVAQQTAQLAIVLVLVPESVPLLPAPVLDSGTEGGQAGGGHQTHPREGNQASS